MAERDDIEQIDLIDLLKLPMQRKFAVLYAENGGNATQAAKGAGYKHPDKQGSRLLTKVEVQQAVRRHLRCLVGNAGEGRETIVDRERNWANADIGDYFETSGDTTGCLKNLDQLTKRQRQCIKKLSWNRNGPVLELHDPGRANRHLAEYEGMLKQKVSDMTPIEAAEAIHDALKQMNEADGTDSS